MLVFGCYSAHNVLIYGFWAILVRTDALLLPLDLEMVGYKVDSCIPTCFSAKLFPRYYKTLL
jgi:hypothetical protein